MFKHKLATVFAALNLSCLAGVQAAPQPDVVTNGNLWSITFFDDSSPAHTQWATQRLCFFTTGTVGTQLAGVWYSPTFFDWNGTWRQEGDQVFMTGDYAGDVNGNAVGHDGVEWQLVTAEKSSEGFGHWKEWRENGRFGQPIGYGNAKLSRLGSCNPTILDTRDPEAIEKLAGEESLKAPRRFRKDGSEAVGPFDADQLPLQQ